METPDKPLPDQIGRYRIVRPLGEGAMGRVLMAHDPVLDRDVAIKLLRDDLKIPSEQRVALLERMRQEARASARVSHPNIVALHDMGEDEELGLYLVFEYVEGITLKERIGRGPLGPEATARLAREIGDALTTAHSAGVLHRDIKPENVIMARTGAKIADFGIARVPDSTLTRDGGLLGTPAYSAPEAIASGKFSPLSDQFSMAATLYEAVCMHRAFPGDDAVAVASKISTDEPAQIAEVCGLDPHVDSVLARALSKNPKARFGSCEEFGRALAEALDLTPRTRMPTLPDEQHRAALGEPTESRGTRIAVGGAAVGALLAIAGFQLTAHLRPDASDTLAASEPSDAAAPRPTGWLAEPPAQASEKPRRPRRRKPAREPAADAGSDSGKADSGSSDSGTRGVAAEAEAGAEGGSSTGAQTLREDESGKPAR